MNELPEMFLSRPEAKKLRQTQTMEERGIWARYFTKHGCVSCGDRTGEHGGKGFCGRCYHRTRDRLRAIETELRDEFDRRADTVPFKSLAESKQHGFVRRYAACAVLGLDYRTVETWIHRGHFEHPDARFAGRDLWTAEDIERLRLFAEYRLRRPVRYKHPEIIEQELERETSRRLRSGEPL